MNPAIKRDDGVAIVVALVMTLIVGVMLTVGTIWVMSGLRGNGVSASRNGLVQLADGVSDQARLQIIYRYQTNTKPFKTFLSGLRAEINQSKSVNLGRGTTAVWTVRRVSEGNDPYGWVDIHATVRQNQNVQTVIRRVSFGDSPVFKLAMLSEDTNCIYCHMTVKGDVGSLNFLRPGWALEGSPDDQHAGDGSRIKGDLYVAASKADPSATNVTNDSSSNVDPQTPGQPTVLNGLQVSGTLNLRDSSNVLPSDTDNDGIPDFPGIDDASARANATGTLTGGLLKQGVPLGQTYGANKRNVGTVSGVYDGNLVLTGTQSKPITLDGDIYVTGDVVIKGVVTGRGAIYSGRNTYVAGDLTSKNGPDALGEGVCVNDALVSGESQQAVTQKNESCARANIAAGRDELRLASRGNTVIGDYTEQDAGGNLKPFNQRQSADYYRPQFGMGFWDSDSYKNNKFYFEKGTGTELTRKEKMVNGVLTPEYRTVDNRLVPAGDTVTRTPGEPGSADDAYVYAFKPGSVQANGTFKSWLTDDEYRSNLLGSQSVTMNTWRSSLPWPWDTATNATMTKAKYVSTYRDSLKASGIPDSMVDQTLERIYDRKLFTGSQDDLNITDGNVRVYVAEYGLLRVMVKNATPFETQVKKIDAFVYSNRRIAGRSNMTPLGINGGLIAKEIGILAPGRAPQWWAPETQELADPSASCGAATTYYVKEAENCGLTLNYDYRLRSGGYGFNLVSGVAGQTILWQIADSAAAQVQP